MVTLPRARNGTVLVVAGESCGDCHRRQRPPQRRRVGRVIIAIVISHRRRAQIHVARAEYFGSHAVSIAIVDYVYWCVWCKDDRGHREQPAILERFKRQWSPL